MTFPSPPDLKPRFDFTVAMRRLCAHACAGVPELSHIVLDQVAIGTVQARSPSRGGVQASLTPLRFLDGAREQVRRGRRWRIEAVQDEQGREMLYLLTFVLPRFQNQSFQEKLVTVFHELWHISPQFNGDLRRHAGRCFAHSHSRKVFDSHLTHLVERYLCRNPPAQVLEFLNYDFAGLKAACGPIHGVRYRRPRLHPAPDC